MARALLLLARAPGLPEGDTAQGLEMDVALTPQGQIDAAAWQADPEPWRTRRFAPGEADHIYELIRDDEAWTLRGAAGDDDPPWRLELRTLRPGEYASARTPAGDELVFRVVSVTQAA